MADEIRAATEADIAEVKRRLDTFHSPSFDRECVERLMARIEEAVREREEIKALSEQYMEDTGQAYCYVGIRDYAAVVEREKAASLQAAEAQQRLGTVTAERDEWHDDARRMSGGLIAISTAADSVPASVLRSIAYDIALNCLDPQTAKFQIERRSALLPSCPSVGEPVKCSHDPFEGRCVHCGVPFVDGLPTYRAAPVLPDQALVERLNAHQCGCGGPCGQQTPGYIREAASALTACRDRVPRLEEALDQLLDDMGEHGLCVCQAAKDMARSVLSEAPCK